MNYMYEIPGDTVRGSFQELLLCYSIVLIDEQSIPG